MKALPAVMVLLMLAFSTVQSVSWADCCCGSFCEHKNTCTGCGPEDRCRGRAQTASCCDQEETQPQKTCSHLEPSSEIETGSVDRPELQPFLVEGTGWIDSALPASPPSPPPPPVDTGPPQPIPPGFPVLRI